MSDSHRKLAKVILEYLNELDRELLDEADQSTVDALKEEHLASFLERLVTVAR